MADEGSENTRDNFGKVIYQFKPETKTLIRKLKRILIKLNKQNVSLLSDKTGWRERLLSKNRHTYCIPQRDCFFISRNFSVTRLLRRFKMESKPKWLYVSRTSYSRAIVILSVSEAGFFYVYFFIYAYCHFQKWIWGFILFLRVLIRIGIRYQSEVRTLFLRCCNLT